MTSVISPITYIIRNSNPSPTIAHRPSFATNSYVFNTSSFQTITVNKSTEVQSILPQVTSISLARESTRLEKLIQRNQTDPNIYLLGIKSLLHLVPDNGYPEDLVLHSLNTPSTETLRDIWRDNAEKVHYSCSKNPINYSFCQRHWMLSWDSYTRHFTYYKEQPGFTNALVL